MRFYETGSTLGAYWIWLWGLIYEPGMMDGVMEDKMLRTTEEIDAVLMHLAGWRRDEEFLRKDFVFENFAEINEFLPFFSETVVKLNHHPDFEFVGGEKRLSVEVTTHSAGCVTQADLELAATLNAWRED